MNIIYEIRTEVDANRRMTIDGTVGQGMGRNTDGQADMELTYNRVPNVFGCPPEVR